jgi:hypothetical protein
LELAMNPIQTPATIGSEKVWVTSVSHLIEKSHPSTI